MRKKVIIASFFVMLLLAVPCISAFEMKLSTDQRKDLERLIENEEEAIKTELQGLINSNGALDIDEVETILEKAIDTGDYSVLETDPWTWITNRLGWVYITVEYVLDIYYAGLNLKSELDESFGTVSFWWQSIQDLRAAWNTFKDNPLNWQNIVDLLNAIKNVFNATVALIEEVIEEIESENVLNAVYAFRDTIVDFKNFLESYPWENPITIYGEVNGFTEDVTISTNMDSQTTMTNYSVLYDTSASKFSWFVQKCVVNAEYQDKETSKSAYAFSMGSIEMDWEQSDFTAKTKTKTIQPSQNIFMKIFEKLQMFLLNFKTIFNINTC